MEKFIGFFLILCIAIAPMAIVIYLARKRK